MGSVLTLGGNRPSEPIGDTDGPEAVQNPAARAYHRRLKITLPILVTLILMMSGFTSHLVSSGSMSPNLLRGDHIITMRSWIAYPGGRMPNRGDVILFHSPILADGNRASRDDVADKEGQLAGYQAAGDILVKRVVALPGETVQVINNIVYVNGTKLPMDYQVLPANLEEGPDYKYAVDAPLVVPSGEVFVLGDNYDNSEDGRFWGTLPRNEIVGRCVGVLFHEGQAGPNSARLLSASNTSNDSQNTDP